LEGALELDVDALCDGDGAWVAAIVEHVEPAGVHSGDSACVLPGPSVTPALDAEARAIATGVARGLGPRRLLHLQLAPHEGRRHPMRSTGEGVAGGATAREAYARALRAAGRSRRGGEIGPPLQLARVR